MTTKIRFPTPEETRSGAYQVYPARFSALGHDLDDWLQAEYEMMQLPLHKIAELEANAIESNNLTLFSLARLGLPLKERSSKKQNDY
jgi:hypothetical protein